ncbi:Flagellar cap protein [Serratia rubidaea]|uniref:Flagellar hook-associated protein 2 n=1 Tax=Serratia rubidaea TaxID=61652 RepID=A0A4U9HNK6_SERRU|nr:Flagellar cap protein [Serratia rubidaea]
MAAISSLGISTGMDMNGLLDKLSQAEKQRLTPYTTQQSSYNAKLTAYGTLKGALEKFDNLSKELAKPEFFTNTTASKHDQFNVTTNAKAVPGNYTITVDQLAQPQTLTTKAHIASQTEKLGESGASDRSPHPDLRQPAESGDHSARRRPDVAGGNARRHQRRQGRRQRQHHARRRQ